MPCAGMIHPWLGQDMDRVRLNKNKDLQNPSPKKSLLGRPNEAMRFFLSSGEKTQPISLAFFVIPDPCSSDVILQHDQFINDKSVEAPRSERLGKRTEKSQRIKPMISASKMKPRMKSQSWAEMDGIRCRDTGSMVVFHSNGHFINLW